MYGYIYLTTNLVNQKKYIGQHKSETFDPKYYGSGTLFIKALKRYKKKNFSIQLLCECNDADELNKKEIYYIELYNAVSRDDFYNISYGGYRNSIRGLKCMYNEKIDKMIHVPEDLVDKYINLGFRLGMRPKTDAQKQHHKEGRVGLIPITNDIETKYIKECDLFLYTNDGWRKGRIPTRPNQKEENRIWMYKDDKSVMVKSSDMQKFINLGYQRGRSKFKSFTRIASAHNKGKKQVFVDGKKTYI